MYLSVFSLVCLGLVLSDILVSNKSGHKIDRRVVFQRVIVRLDRVNTVVENQLTTFTATWYARLTAVNRITVSASVDASLTSRMNRVWPAMRRDAERRRFCRKLNNCIVTLNTHPHCRFDVRF